MKTRLLIFGGVLLLSALIIGATAGFARGGRHQPAGAGPFGPANARHAGPGPHSLLTIAAQQLEITPADLRDAITGGATIAELADAAGVDTTAIVDAYVDIYRERLDGAVEQGRLTQAEADEKLLQIAEQAADKLEQPWQASDKPARHGRLGHHPAPFAAHALLGVAAEQLDMTPAEIRGALTGSDTIAGIAEAQGLDTTAIVDAVVSQASDRLQQMVDAGRIDQAQMDAKLSEIEENVTQKLDQEWDPSPKFNGSCRGEARGADESPPDPLQSL